MHIVIDIDEEVYDHILKAESVPDLLGIDIVNAVNAVKNGKMLPEKWLKDYRRLLEEEKNWRKSLEDEIAKTDEKIRSLKAELGIKAESKSNTSELKPCPFCGTKVELTRMPLWHGNHGYHDCFSFKVKCPKCGCSVDYIDNDTIYRSEEEAVANVVKAWNERHLPNPKTIYKKLKLTDDDI